MASHVPPHGVALGLLGIGLVFYFALRPSSIPEDDMVSPGWIRREIPPLSAGPIYHYPDGHTEQVIGDTVTVIR